MNVFGVLSFKFFSMAPWIFVANTFFLIFQEVDVLGNHCHFFINFLGTFIFFPSLGYLFPLLTILLTVQGFINSES